MTNNELITFNYSLSYLLGFLGTKDFISNYIIPLPPLAEQQHIVTKVEELLAIIESLKV